MEINLDDISMAEMNFKKKKKWRKEEMGKTLIAYFSKKGENYVNGSIVNLLVGNTEVATNVAQVEKNQDARPELATHVENMDEYDTIILGYPNWWGTMPMAVFAFLEEYDFTGKTILPYCTHEGSGLGGSERDIKRVCPAANVEKGLAIHGSSVKSASGKIKSWLS